MIDRSDSFFGIYSRTPVSCVLAVVLGILAAVLDILGFETVVYDFSLVGQGAIGADGLVDAQCYLSIGLAFRLPIRSAR